MHFFRARPLHVERSDENVMPFSVTKTIFGFYRKPHSVVFSFDERKLLFAQCSPFVQRNIYRRVAIMRSSAKRKFSAIFTYRRVAATGWQKQRTPGIGTPNTTESDCDENWCDTRGNDRERARARVRIRMHEILLHFYGRKKCETKIPRRSIGAHEAEDDYVDDNRQRPRWWW